MAEYRLFNYITYVDPDDGRLIRPDRAGQNPVEADPGPLKIGDPGPRILNAEISTFAGVTPNGLMFTFNTYGSDYITILTLNSVPAYGDTITNISQITVSEVPYNFDSVFCFLEGTRIATPYGEVPVETLRIGDEICNSDSAPVRVKWLGQQRVPHASLLTKSAPVVVTQGAIGDGMPHTAL